MPYVSNNYRFQERSKLKSLIDAVFFVAFSTVAILLILFVLGWFSTNGAQAAGINQQLNYQGRINTATGVPVPNGTYNIKLAIYDVSSGGTCLWTAAGSCADNNIGTTTVSVVNGIFSVALGAPGQNSLATSTIDWNSAELYLGVAVKGTNATPVYDDEMTPRKRLTSAAYAFNADAVNGFHATSTAAVANYLMALDANKVLNLYDGGVSSTYATSSRLYVSQFIRLASTTSATQGVIYAGDTTFIHRFGFDNIFVGRYAGNFTTLTGERNVGMGENALNYLTTGYGNVALGYSTLLYNTTGWNNVAVGAVSLLYNTTGFTNTAIGRGTLHENTTGSYNTALGWDAGYGNITGDYNTFLGWNAHSSATDLTRAIAIGASSTISVSNGMALGGTGSWAVSVGINTSTPGSWYNEKLTVVGDTYTTGIIRLASTTSRHCRRYLPRLRALHP